MSAFQINLNPLKEPIRFIKVLQWIASIFAFATCGGFKGKTEILVNCPLLKVNENHTVEATFGYPFRNPLIKKFFHCYCFSSNSSSWAFPPFNLFFITIPCTSSG
uniref:Uncharacterized protein n=1 Tax=Spermophilus dauricus TaxID=99837 RepID=A0A8C9QM02_SPEDA